MLKQTLKNTLLLLVLALAGLFFSTTKLAYAAAVNGYDRVNFQGKVVNADGTNVTNGSYNFDFILYDDDTAGTNRWQELTKSITVTNGVFQTELGSATALPDFNTYPALYLAIRFNADAAGYMSPRIHLNAVPYAKNAEHVDRATVTTLGIGDVNATAITIGNTTNSSILFKTKQVASAFQVQNASANEILTIDTSATETSNLVRLGKASTINGRIVFNNSTNANTITVVSGVTSASYSLTLPTGGPAVSQCLQTDSVTASQLLFAACAAGSAQSLQQVYDTGANATVNTSNARDITLNLTEQTTDPSLIVNLQCTTCSASGGRFAVQSAATDVLSVAPNGGTVSLGIGGFGNTIQIGNITGAVTQTINIGNNTTALSVTNVNIGSNVGGSNVNVICGTSTCNWGANAKDNTTTLGSITGSSLTTLQGGTGGINIGTANVAQTIQIGNITSAIAQTIAIGNNATGGGTPSTDTITIGNLLSTSSTTIQGGTGASAIALTQGSGGTITIGGTAGASAVTINAGTGGLVLKPITSNTTAMTVQDSGAAKYLILDTTNARLQVGDTAADATGVLLVLDTKNTSGEPTGVNGAMYYNSNLNKFRCYEYGSWLDCISGLGNQNWFAVRANGAGKADVGTVSTATTLGAAASNDTDNTYESLATNTTTGNLAGYVSNTYKDVRRAYNPTCSFLMRTPSSIAAGYRLWIGLFTANPTNADDSGGSYIGFRYTSGTDTTWKAKTRDGTTASADSAVGATVAVSTAYLLKLRVDSAANTAYFSVNGSTEVSIASNLPATATELGFDLTIITTDTTADTFKLSRIYCEYGG